MTQHYVLNIPMYFYNTGRADNGSGVKTISYESLDAVIEARDWLNDVWENMDFWTILDAPTTARLENEFLDGVGYQEELSYVTQLTIQIIE